MDTVQILDIIIKIAVSTATALITAFVIPALVKLSSKIEDSRIFNFIKRAVNAAEQLYGPKSGVIKKQYVTDIVKKAFGKLLTDEQIDALIESAVYHISQEIKNAKTQHTEENINKVESKPIEVPKIREG